MDRYPDHITAAAVKDCTKKTSTRALANGWHIGAVAGQENHGAFYGNRVGSDGTIKSACNANYCMF